MGRVSFANCSMRVLFGGKCGPKRRYRSVAPENGLRATGFAGITVSPGLGASLAELRRPLIIRDFITALYRRDSPTATCRGTRLFFAEPKTPVLYSSGRYRI